MSTTTNIEVAIADAIADAFVALRHVAFVTGKSTDRNERLRGHELAQTAMDAMGALATEMEVDSVVLALVRLHYGDGNVTL